MNTFYTIHVSQSYLRCLFCLLNAISSNLTALLRTSPSQSGQRNFSKSFNKIQCLYQPLTPLKYTIGWFLELCNHHHNQFDNIFVLAVTNFIPITSLHGSAFSGYFIYTELYSKWSFGPGFFHSVYFHCPSALKYVSVFHFFLRF